MRITKRQLKGLIQEAVLCENDKAIENDVIAALSVGDTKVAAGVLHSYFGEDAYYFFDEMRPVLASAPGIDKVKRGELYNAVEDELYNLRKASPAPPPKPSRKKGKRAIMHIVKKHGGKSRKKTYPGTPPEYEFPDERTAAQVVWIINDETGREAANSGNVVTVYT